MNINSIKEALAAKAAGIKTFNASKQDGTTVQNVKMEDVEVKPDKKSAYEPKQADSATQKQTEAKKKAQAPKSDKAESDAIKGNYTQKSIESVVARILKPHVDYGMVPGCRKPSLLKAGAEKLAVYYGLHSGVEITDRIQLLDKGFVSYEVKATLCNKDGIMVAQGVGSCNSRERKYCKSNLADIMNTCLKMAKKRGFVDAVLTATGASGFFTQDMEDIASGSSENHRMEGIG